MFMGPWDQGGPWSPTGIGGVHRFLNRVWTLAIDPHGREPGDPESGSLPAGETEADGRGRRSAPAAHRTLATSPTDYEAFHFNTMVAKLMELANTLFRYRGTAVAGSRRVGRGHPPAAADAGPGRAAHHRGAVEPPPGRGRRAVVSIHRESWPEVDVAATAEATREVPVQVNGKLRDKLTVPTGIDARRARGGRARQPEGRGGPRGTDAGPHHPGRRRPARQHRRPRLTGRGGIPAVPQGALGDRRRGGTRDQGVTAQRC